MISIIISPCNSANHLDRLLSFLFEENSSRPIFESIILDRNAEYDTKQVILQYAIQGFIRHIKIDKDLCLLGSYNLAATKARHPYLLFLRSDVYYFDNFFSIIMKTKPAPNNGIIYKINQTGNQDGHFQLSNGPLQQFLSKNSSTDVTSEKHIFEADGVCLLCRRDDFIGLKSQDREMPIDKPLAINAQNTSTTETKKSAKPSKKTDNKDQEYIKAEKTVQNLRYKLFNLGFIERAYSDLEKLTSGNNPDKRRLAARELALWHANKRNEEDAHKCLEWLAIAIEGEKDLIKLHQATVLEAEALNTLGKTKQAQKVIEESLKKGVHTNLYLAMANLDQDLSWKLTWINDALNLHGLSKVACDPVNKETLYEGLSPAFNESNLSLKDSGPKVTILMPAYNAKDSIHIAIDSILNQTWANLELLIVDDCSTDETVKVIQNYEQKDDRVRLIKAKRNAGAYVARNLGLKMARGEFVTVNDADDWSHPEKIEIQVTDLINNSSLIANTTKLVRVFSDLTFYRRGNYGSYIIKNSASLMFRRKQILDKIGYWDCVRFGADADFIERVSLVFGIKNLDSGPLTFARQAKHSLTADSKFGVDGALFGCRLEYTEARRYHHKTSSSLRYEFNEKNRSMFPVPEPMKPDYSAKKHSRRHFDVIIASDFRLPGGTTASNIQEILAQRSFKLRTGLLHIPRFDFNPKSVINSKVRNLLDGNYVQMITYGEKISCDLLIIRHPPVLQENCKFIPDVQAKDVRIIVNQLPKRDYSYNSTSVYNIKDCIDNLNRYFGKTGTWHPIGPLVRKAIIEHHSEDLNSILLSGDDWLNIIDTESWDVPRRSMAGARPILGRHSRDQYVKWPSDKNELLAAYPDDKNFEVKILGGAETARKILGYIPDNWSVYQFDSVDPKDFLAQIDIFVYFTHPGWVEAFGRTPLEAMAVGVPVILPKTFKPLFQEAAIYATPYEVQDIAIKLCENMDHYKKQSKACREFVKKYFSYDIHKRRLTPLIGKLSTEINSKSQNSNISVTKNNDNFKESNLNNIHTILNAYQMMLNKNIEDGLAFARSKANPIEKPAINILRANMDLDDDTLWLKHVNQYLRQFDIAPIDLLPSGPSRFLRISCKTSKIITEGPLVSVIMPAYNAEKTLSFAARSILNQTWQKLELIIVDDASTDNTWKVANNLAGRDYRVKILRNTVNVGPYVSKNYALRVANGDFITGQDSDDWAHPQRVEKHLQLHIAEGANTRASLIGMLRIAENGSFTRISKVTSNCQDGVLNGAFISTLFEYKFLREIIGHWDEVRFAGDSELIKRVEIAQKAPLRRFHFLGLFVLESPDSLTSDPTHGYSPERGLSTTRKKYRNSFTAWHKTLNPKNTFLSFPQTERKFFIPTEMSVNKENIIRCLHGHNDYIYECKKQYANISKIYREFYSDICIITDLRLPGGNASSTLDEIDFFLSINKKVFVIDCPSAAKAGETISTKYYKYNSICELFYNIDFVKTDLLIIRAPAIIETGRFQSLIKKIVSKKAIFVLNNSILTPKNNTVYSFSDLENTMAGLDSQIKKIFPLGPAIRNELMRLGHSKSKLLSSYDWPPTFKSESFPFNPKYRIAKPYVIGRHGRDGREKWLEDEQQLRLAYPSSSSFHVKILGGAFKAEKILGSIPENWTVYPFGSMEPKEYLSKLDAFVYFPHSRLNEAFGRTIMEAIFAGVPCILPHRFKETFENMAFFCEPADVTGVVERLSFHQEKRINFLTLVRDFAVSNFDSKALLKRIKQLECSGTETNVKNPTSITLPPETLRYVSWVEKGFLVKEIN